MGNWPSEELILKNQIPSLDPPVEIFRSVHEQLTSRKAIGTVEDMAEVFLKFCHILIHFITNAVFKHGFSRNLKRIDVSGLSGKDGLGTFISREYSRKLWEQSWEYKNKQKLRLGDILQGIRNSKN